MPYMMRNLRAILGVALTVLLGVMLIATIYFTLFDLEWIAFLAGVLFAAIAATASQLSKAQWIIARRTKQLQRARDALAQESARRERAAEAQKVAEARLQLINDALPVMIAFVDRDERCRYHNPAFAQWRGRDGKQIEGHTLREVVGDEIYRDLKSRSADVFTGKEVRYEVEWRQPGGEIESCAVTLLPYPPDAERPSGFYALIASMVGGAAPAATAAHPGESIGDVMVGAHESGETFYLESMTEQLIGGKDPRAQLVRALQDDQFILFAQTIRPLAAAAPWPRLFEVLLRLQEEEQHMAPPGGFIPVAERYNLMAEIDRWVVRNLLKWTLEKQRSDAAWRMPLYCVNLAGSSLCDPEFALYVRAELRRQKFTAGNLCFELAEPDVIDHHAAAQAFMGALRPLGCRFTLDAFGSTKVSFAPLKGLTLDFLKIDGIIIQNILQDPAELARTRAIVLASHKIGMRAIAEFVESEETLAKLREIGVDYAQGFGIGKPGPIAEVSWEKKR
ncbi:MAG: EAL domain-containing protein [Betaproteobacteria bacterium]|nr:EAL domain-containing protein [Betaproteobacteria bacterium]